MKYRIKQENSYTFIVQYKRKWWPWWENETDWCGNDRRHTTYNDAILYCNHLKSLHKYPKYFKVN